ncbi:MAG: DUF2752 domain-containing protein [Oscillospiraceae bacterium]|nr:DUF2752 domain-containing protein [Oscillospiraceae bacterium]
MPIQFLILFRIHYVCPFYALTNIYCPGCGGTRALLALLDGNLRLSVHENPAVLVLGICCMLYTLEKILKSQNRLVKLLPRNPIFWGILIALWIIWDVFRNLIPELMPLT